MVDRFANALASSDTTALSGRGLALLSFSFEYLGFPVREIRKRPEIEEPQNLRSRTASSNGINPFSEAVTLNSNVHSGVSIINRLKQEVWQHARALSPKSGASVGLAQGTQGEDSLMNMLARRWFAQGRVECRPESAARCTRTAAALAASTLIGTV